jgi:hypothetical protein
MQDELIPDFDQTNVGVVKGAKDHEKTVEKQLLELNGNDEDEDDFDFGDEVDEEKFQAHMIKTFGEVQYKKSYDFVYNFRAKLDDDKTKAMLIKNLTTKFGILNDKKAERFITLCQVYIHTIEV